MVATPLFFLKLFSSSRCDFGCESIDADLD